jgi:hypothetical protein
MKRILILFITNILLILSPCLLYVVSHASSNDDIHSTADRKKSEKIMQVQLYKENKIFFIIEKACADINKNMTFLTNLYTDNEFDGIISGYFSTVIADKILSQPISVINLMSKLNIPITKMCPKDYFEDNSDDYEHWKEMAIVILDNFTMSNAVEEKIRVDCLKAIKKSLRK